MGAALGGDNVLRCHQRDPRCPIWAVLRARCVRRRARVRPPTPVRAVVLALPPVAAVVRGPIQVFPASVHLDQRRDRAEPAGRGDQASSFPPAAVPAEAIAHSLAVRPAGSVHSLVRGRAASNDPAPGLALLLAAIDLNLAARDLRQAPAADREPGPAAPPLATSVIF